MYDKYLLNQMSIYNFVVSKKPCQKTSIVKKHPSTNWRYPEAVSGIEIDSFCGRTFSENTLTF